MARIEITTKVDYGYIHVSVNVYIDEDTTKDACMFTSYEKHSEICNPLGFDNRGVCEEELWFSKKYEWSLEKWQQERKKAIKEAKSLIAKVSDMLSEAIPDFLPDEKEIIEVEQPLYKEIEEE